MIVRFLREFFNEADNIIHENNGIFDKFMGDGIIAIFEFKNGNSYDHITSALDEVNSGIELNNSSEKIRNEWIKIWKDQFGLNIEHIYLKCGINTGEALIGKINTEKRDHFTVFGSTVTLASRLGELTKKIKLLFQKKQKTIL